MYQTLLESASFCKRYDKTFWSVIFRFTVLTAVHLQNVNAKFHKVGQRHYSTEAENILHFCITNLLRTICTKFYDGRSGFVDFIKKHFGLSFSVHSIHAAWFTGHLSECTFSIRILFKDIYQHMHFTFISHTHSILIYFYSAPVEVRSIVINPSVCVSVCLSDSSVCPRAYLWNRWTDRHKILCADPTWPWLGSPLTALRYVMYFRFSG